jgi:hypothetical protein
MDSGKELPAGTMVAFSTGCYSDYSVNGFAKLLKPLNQSAWEEMVEAALEPNEYATDGKSFERTKAMAWLIANGYIEDTEYVELHMGDYGDTPSWADA